MDENDTCKPRLNESVSISAFFVANCVVNAILSPVAVAGNALVLAVIWRNPSLRTPSYVLLGGLALTDFCTGLISQPSFVIFNLGLSKGNQLLIQKSDYVLTTVSYYLSTVAFTTITLMSLERWLYMSRPTLVTLRRVLRVYVFVLLQPIPFTILSLWSPNNSLIRQINIVVPVCITTIGLAVTPFAYFKVFQIIRRHQRQVHANQPSQNFGQPAINIQKYKKSVYTLLYILVLFLITYLPIYVYFAIRTSLEFGTKCKTFVSVLTLSFSTASFNPLLYFWRMKDIRDGVKQLVKKLLCRD